MLSCSLQSTQNFKKLYTVAKITIHLGESGSGVLQKVLQYFCHQILLLQLQYFWPVLLTTLTAGYIQRWFTCPQAVTPKYYNPARCTATSTTEHNALPLRQAFNH